MKIRFAEELQPVLLLAPVAITSSVVQSNYLRVNKAHWASFLVQFGAFSDSDDTCTVGVTVECSTASASNATEEAITYKYRLSGTVGTSTWGTITETTSTTGIEIKSETDENKMLLIDVDPSKLDVDQPDGFWLRVVLKPGATGAATDVSGIVSVTGILEPRYPGNSMPSATS